MAVAYILLLVAPEGKALVERERAPRIVLMAVRKMYSRSKKKETPLFIFIQIIVQK